MVAILNTQDAEEEGLRIQGQPELPLETTPPAPLSSPRPSLPHPTSHCSTVSSRVKGKDLFMPFLMMVTIITHSP